MCGFTYRKLFFCGLKAQRRVAHNIRKLRVRRGLSQENLAIDAGIDRTYVGRLERRNENPTVAVLERLAAGLVFVILRYQRQRIRPTSW